jgi:hypothetical protein
MKYPKLNRAPSSIAYCSCISRTCCTEYCRKSTGVCSNCALLYPWDGSCRRSSSLTIVSWTCLINCCWWYYWWVWIGCRFIANGIWCCIRASCSVRNGSSLVQWIVPGYVVRNPRVWLQPRVQKTLSVANGLLIGPYPTYGIVRVNVLSKLGANPESHSSCTKLPRAVVLINALPLWVFPARLWFAACKV